jgi:hypothetical protein
MAQLQRFVGNTTGLDEGDIPPPPPIRRRLTYGDEGGDEITKQWIEARKKPYHLYRSREYRQYTYAIFASDDDGIYKVVFSDDTRPLTDRVIGRIITTRRSLFTDVVDESNDYMHNELVDKISTSRGVSPTPIAFSNPTPRDSPIPYTGDVPYDGEGRRRGGRKKLLSKGQLKTLLSAMQRGRW